jgi:hypothetical protein
MISDSTASWNIAKWVANAKSVDVSEIVHRQHIWQQSPNGSSDVDRCSLNANQMNHAPVVVYGNSGTVQLRNPNSRSRTAYSYAED